MEQLLANPILFWKDYHAWIIGFLLIAFSSYKRFNIPSTSRSCTTYGRYHTAALLYMAVTILGWLTLAHSPSPPRQSPLTGSHDGHDEALRETSVITSSDMLAIALVGGAGH